MALSAGVINIDLTLDNTQYQVSVTEAGTVTRQLTQELTTAQTHVEGLGTVMESFGSKIVSTAAGFAAFNLGFEAMHELFVSLPGAIIKASAEMERMTELMRGFSTATTFEGKEADAQKWSDSLLQMAQTTPFHLKNITDAFIKMKSAGLDPLDGTLQGTMEAISKFGGGSQQLEHAALALQQMAGKGAVSMEELRRQLAEVIPDAANKMAEGMGMSYATLMQHIQKGVVESKNAIQQMTTMWLIEDEGSAAKMMTTWNGLIEQLQTKWFMFLNQVGKDGAFQQLKQTLQGLLDSFDGLSGRQFGHELGQDLNALVAGFIAVKNALVEYGGAIKVVGETFLTYWALSKLKSIGDAGVKMYQDIMAAGVAKAAAEKKNQIEAKAEAVAENALQQEKIAGLIAQQDEILALGARDRERLLMRADTMQAELNMERAAAAERQALRQQEMAQEAATLERKIQMIGEELKIRTDALNAYEAQATAANTAIIALEEERAAIVNRLGEFGGKNQIADLDRQLQNQLQIAVATENAAAAQAAQVSQMRAAIPVMREQQAALDTLARAEVQVGVAGEESATMQINALQQQAAAITQTTAVEAKAALQAQATTAALEGERLATVGLDQASINAAKSVGTLDAALDALGGPLGLITMALTLGATAWMSWGETAENAVKKADDALHSHLADQTTLKTYQDQLTQLKRELADQQELIRNKGAYTTYNEEGVAVEFGPDPDMVAKAQARAKEITDLIAKTEANIADARTQIVENTAQRQYEDEKRIRDRAYNQRMSDFQTESDKEEKVRKDLLDKLGNDPGNKQHDTIIKAGTEELKARATAFYNSEIEILRHQQTEALAKIASTNPPVTKQLGQDELKGIDEQLDQLQAKLKRAQALGTYKETGAKTPKNTPVDPVVKLLETAKGKLDEAIIGAKTLQTETQSFLSIYQQTYAKLEAQINAGKLQFQGKNPTMSDPRMNQAVFAEAAAQFINLQNNAIKKMAQTAQAGGVAAADAFDRMSGRVVKSTNDVTKLEQEYAKVKDLFVGNKPLGDAFDLNDPAQARAAAAIQQMNKNNATMKQWYDQALGNAAIKNSGDEFAKLFNATTKMNDEAVVNKRDRLEIQYQDALNEAQREYDLAVSYDQKYIKKTDDRERAIAALQDQWDKYKEAMAAKHQRDMMTPVDQLVEKWQSATDAMQQASAKWAQGTIDEIMKFVTTGKLEFGKFVESILADILKIQLEASMGKQLGGTMNSLESAITNALGMGNNQYAAYKGMTFTPGGTASSADMNAVNGLNAKSYFANGGIMTEYGPLELRKYADGGIADRPQMAIYGEAGPEAYVPLPDGRSIPVTLSGSAGGQAPTVVVNVINQSSQNVNAQQGQGRFDGKQYVLDVVLTAANQPGQFRDGLKGALTK